MNHYLFTANTNRGDKRNTVISLTYMPPDYMHHTIIHKFPYALLQGIGKQCYWSLTYKRHFDHLSVMHINLSLSV